ncbi:MULTISPECIES: ABC transporter permease subunit [Tissierellales]|jgi:simple sugar transport system permease protein|uniref:ABC transporter permease n=1 Tax=Acidilutibacter cellobiosedens TaxID=2507161 RepID=A0A410QCU3_9FIRM|nr:MULTISPECIES: ABC transporter permease [Tissierellales]MBE6082915.1 ABC transporter permease [Tissierellaceae bacterium]QAT61815.1 ABC transporter permease [Acidilutibacter cellobiosedens]SCL82046.1 putative ABC-type sugar transport system, permease component [Sporanaerobacter sp. PP17-6a]
MNYDKRKMGRLLTGSAVPVLFLVISIIAIPLSQFSGIYLADQIVTRLVRNSFLVLSLLLPIMAGMGINFGMTLGAMAGQIGLIFINDWGVGGAWGLMLAALVSTPIAIVLGYFGGVVLNRAKGREMITSMMLGLFISGIYQFFLLYVCGSLINFKNPGMLLSRGYGVRNALNLATAKGFDNLWMIRIGSASEGVNIPLGTFMIIGLLCLFTFWFRKTKLGHDMRAVGLEMNVSDSAGINVEKTRIQSIVISTVLACYGQIIYLQNIGTLNTYNGADQAALFAAASLLVGGATVARATIPNAIIGTILFHLMFIVMPMAGKYITGQAMIGEYFRMFISYGVVTTALILHSWKRQKDKDMDRRMLRLDTGGKNNVK